MTTGQALCALRAFASVNNMYTAPPHNCKARRFDRRNVPLPARVLRHLNRPAAGLRTPVMRGAITLLALLL